MDTKDVNFFSLNHFMLKLGGMWFPTDHSNRVSKICFLAYDFMCIFICQIYYTPTELYKLKDTYKSPIILVEHVGMLLTHLLALAKLTVWFTQHERAMEILKGLGGDEFVYEAHGTFQPTKIMRKLKRGSFILNIMFITAALGVPATKEIASAIDLYHVDTESFGINISCSKLLPYYSLIPFSTSSKTSCANAILFQAVPMFLCGFQITGKYYCYLHYTMTALMIFRNHQ